MNDNKERESGDPFDYETPNLRKTTARTASNLSSHQTIETITYPAKSIKTTR